MQQPEWPSEDFSGGADSSKSRGKLGVVFCNGSGDLLFFFAELAEIAGGLDVEPELGALFEEFAEFERHFGRDAAAAEHDFVDTSRAYAEGSRKGVLRNAHGHEIVLKENFTGLDGGFHNIYPMTL
jgi:hypothetical protein